MSIEKQTPSQALRQALETEKIFGRRALTEERKADIISRNKDRPFDYDMDDGTRDRLIAHARQDAAQAVILATFIVQRQRRHTFALWIFAGALAYIVWQVS